MKFLTNIKNHIAVLCIVFGLLAAAVVLISWTFGYWMNGLHGTKFQIDSCWQGISACGIGLVGLFKWLVDSSKNSPPGSPPGADIITKFNNINNNAEKGEQKND